jgi:site-specific recombinase XerD
VASENAAKRGRQPAGTAPEKTKPLLGPPRRGRAPVSLPPALEAVHAAYIVQLGRAPLAAETRRTYASKVRGYLAWLAAAAVDGDPLTDPAARDRAVRDYRTHLVAVLKRSNATVNSALAAVDGFYTRRGLGPAAAERLNLPSVAPRALVGRVVLRWLRAANAVDSPRNRALALTPFYAGARIAEVVALNIGDVRLSASRGTVRFYGRGGKPREVELHAELREAYTAWLTDRTAWPGADTEPAFFLNRRSSRLGARGASTIFAAVLQAAGLEDDGSAHVLRHTFATLLVRGGTDLVVVAEMLGHASLDQTRRYTLPTAADRESALDLLPVDR